MKDVVAILQSRIAKRSNEISKFSDDTYEGRLSLVDDEYVESAALCNLLAKEQKQDKRILAEIVQLRREAKRYRWLRNNLGNTVSHWICEAGGDKLDSQLDWAMGFYKSKS